MIITNFNLDIENIDTILGVICDAQKTHEYSEEDYALIEDFKRNLTNLRGFGATVCTQGDYTGLVEDQAFLQCLEAAGVDNWDGYEIAQEMMEEDFE